MTKKYVRHNVFRKEKQISLDVCSTERRLRHSPKLSSVEVHASQTLLPITEKLQGLDANYTSALATPLPPTLSCPIDHSHSRELHFVRLQRYRFPIPYVGQDYKSFTAALNLH
jgi:hypothetical protein